jgi:hypothetical protein
VDFFSVYKELRNRIRKYRPRSIVRTSMDYLWHPVKSKLEELQKHPWQILLLVKWTLQDTLTSDKTGRDIKDSEFDELRQRLFDFPERVGLSAAGSSATLFMRQLLHAQIAFQRDLSISFTREAALLAKLAQDHPLRLLFLSKTGLEPLDFIDLAFAS